MNQQNRLRRKLEKYAIPNLTLYLIICYGSIWCPQGISI